MKPLLLAAALTAALALSACGESKEDKAQNQVCDARADIQSQVETLKALPASPDSISKATTGITSILSSLGDIADAQSDLDSDRKKEVQDAVKTFGDQVKSAASDIVTSGSAANASAAVSSAASELATNFEAAFQPVDCS